MNVVSHYPNVPLTLANPPTQLAERENMQRALVSQTNQSEAYPRERPTAKEGEQLRQKDPQRFKNPQDTQTKGSDTSTDPSSVLFGEEEVEESSYDAQSEEGKKQQEQAEQQAEEIELEQIQELSARDREVKSHENAHAAVGGQYAGSPSYEYQRGPDGRQYAVGGEVPIDVSKVPGDPQATINKMNQVRSAALAPAEPSSQDRKVAAQASSTAAEARRELSSQQGEVAAAESDEDTDSSNVISINSTSNSEGDDASQVSTASLEMQQRGRVIAGVYYNSSNPSASNRFSATA